MFYPETANRHLEDIDKLYRDNQDLVFVLRCKEAYQTERPQRFIDAEHEREEAVKHSPINVKDGNLDGEVEHNEYA